MKKFFFILLGLCIFLCRGMLSQTVSLEMAQQVAENFFLSQTPFLSTISIESHPFGNREQPTMYAFSSSDSWVLISGDKRAQPILAYSDEHGSGFPAEEDMPDVMLYFLEWYNEQIDSMRKENSYRIPNPQWEEYLNANHRSTANRSVIVTPLLIRDGNQNTWRQKGNNSGNDITKSYNKFCPSMHDPNGTYCEHSMVGCVALATAQVMWYWQWPYAAIVQNAQQCRYYDWSLMPYRLTNSSSLQQADMTAHLLYDVAESVNMLYLCQESYAEPSTAADSLRGVFSYNASNIKERRHYINSTWINMIKNELNEHRPILYGGESYTYGKHFFVIDGYDSDNKFHANFGMDYLISNGYFTLDAIYFNDSQLMITNITPNYPSCSPTTIPSTDVWPTHFLIQNGGGITIGNRTVTSGMQGVILSGEYVKLNSGFKVNAGADVYIAIKDMHCDDDRGDILEPIEYVPEIHHTPQRQSIIEASPSATKLLRAGQVLIERNGHTYTITGAEIR